MGKPSKREELKETRERRARKIFLRYMMNSKKLIVIILLVLILIVYNFFQINTRVKNMKQKVNNLQRQAKVLNREVEVLNQKLKKVNSKEFVEEIARKELGLVKPGEILYITVEEEKSDSKDTNEK